MFTARDVMTTNIITVDEKTDIRDAIKLLVENNVTGLPVVSESGCLIGIVTEKDILQFLYKQQSKNKTVADLMTRDIITFQESDNLIEIFKSLMENSFRRVPILADGKLVGIISRKDIIKFLFRKPARSRQDEAE
ncbi:MAG: HPP family protein [Thermodesulfobacteriota bacterium]